MGECIEGQMMRVGMYYNNSDVRIEDKPVPKIGHGEILLKVMASGICGTDVLEWYRKKRAPLVLGHEVTGEIVEVGPGVEKFQVGQRVFVSHHIPCNTCKFCLNDYHTACHTYHTTNIDPGGFTQYTRVPALNVDRGLFVLPDDVSFREGTLIEPLACVIRGQRAANLRVGRTVLILGSGVSGLLHVAMARGAGAARIVATDIDDFRLEAARKFGADHVVNAKEDVPSFVRSVNRGMLADAVFVCAGSLSALEQALLSVDPGGTVEFFATSAQGSFLPLPVADLWRNAITLVTSYGAAPSDLSVALELIAGKRIPVDKLITHCLPLEEINKGFSLVVEARDSIKVVIEPHG